MSYTRKNFNQYEKAFAAHQDEVTAIIERLQEGLPPEDMDGYIDHGARYNVFLIGGDELVAKIPRHDDRNTKYEPAKHVRRSTEALMPCIGRAGLEQLVSISLQEPYAIVCKYAPVTGASYASDAQLSTIKCENFAQVFDNFAYLQKCGLVLDPCHGNVRLQPQRGFTLIDYVCEQYADRAYRNQSFDDKVIEFGAAMLFDASYHEEVPAIGYVYRKACHDLIGPEVAMALEDRWKRECELAVA
jgi:hypothetical protein